MGKRKRKIARLNRLKKRATELGAVKGPAQKTIKRNRLALAVNRAVHKGPKC